MGLGGGCGGDLHRGWCSSVEQVVGGGVAVGLSLGDGGRKSGPAVDLGCLGMGLGLGQRLGLGLDLG